MRVVISEDTNNFYRSELLSIDPSMEIFSINPEDPSNPSWESVPDSDAFLLKGYLSYLPRCYSSVGHILICVLISTIQSVFHVPDGAA